MQESLLSKETVAVCLTDLHLLISVYLFCPFQEKVTMNSQLTDENKTNNTSQEDLSSVGEFSFRNLFRNIVHLGTVSSPEHISQGGSHTFEQSWASFSRYMTGQSWCTTTSHPSPSLPHHSPSPATSQQFLMANQRPPHSPSSVTYQDQQSNASPPMTQSRLHKRQDKKTKPSPLPASFQAKTIASLRSPSSSPRLDPLCNDNESDEEIHGDIPVSFPQGPDSGTTTHQFDDEEHIRRDRGSCYYLNFVQPKRINDHDSNYQGIDLWAWDHPNEFPIGSYSYTIETDGKPPPINWAKENIKTRTRPYKWKCLGIFICPTEGCSYRARPQCPRRGKDKFCTTDNKKPTLKVKQQCSTHPTSEMTYQKCRAYWYMIPDGRKKVWTVHHVGVHEHQAPPAISAGGDARELIRKYLSVDPKMTVTELLMGNDIRPSIGEANIRFYNPNYLKHILREERKKVYNRYAGNSKAFDSLDTVFEFNRQLLDKNKHIMRRNIHQSKECPFIAINFQSTVMEKFGCDPLTFKEVDTIMSITETHFFKEPLYVTMSSGWNPVIQSQFPILVSLHTKMTAEFQMVLH